MKFKFPRGLIWIPSIIALAGSERFNLKKIKTNPGLKIKSKSKPHVKRINYIKGWDKKAHYTK